MSGRLDDLAKELLEKTRAERLKWIPVPGGEVNEEEFSVELGEGYRFHILSLYSGEDRSMRLQLFQGQRLLLESGADNWPGVLGVQIDLSKVKRFRLYSDLFDAVRENVYSGDETLGKVEQLLRKIG